MLLSLVVLCVAPSYAQSPLKADPQHFKLEFEDDRIRVLRFRLMPGETSPFHEHSVRITVVLTDGRLKIVDTDGASFEINVYAGAAERQLPTRHTIQNIGDRPYEELTTEFKDKASQPPPYVAKAEPKPVPPPAPKKAEPPKTIEAKKADLPKPQPSAPTASQQKVPDTKPPAPPTVTPGKTPQPEPATQEVAKAEPPPPPAPVPIIRPLKTRPRATEAPSGRRSRRSTLSEDDLSVASVNGTELAFYDKGQGTPIIFVHPSTRDFRAWHFQINALAPNYRVISYSRRYHYPNPSTGKEEDYTYEQNVKDLAEFITALRVAPVHLVGHGYGAAVAAMLAKQYPQLVRGLVLSEPGFDNLLDSQRAYRTRYAREEIFTIIRKPLSKTNPEKGVQVYHDWLADTEPWSRLDAEEQYERKQNADALRAQTQFPLAPAFNCEDAKQIKIPALIVAGQNRSPNSAEITGVLSACLPNSERVSITNTGPAAYLDNAAEYNQALAQFLAKHSKN
ncbi:MAG TPA: alpha/beta fold hydrolase [Terriglobales bacterium]|nr:alpha/beta fold hydrolase [Terriglobales bacterium]